MENKQDMGALFARIKEKLRTDKKILLLILFGIGGMLLLLLTDSGSSEKSEPEKTAGATVDFSAYEAELTDQVTQLLCAVDGAGQVRVLLTLDCREEYVYAADEELSEDKSDTSSHIERKKSYIVIDNDKLTGKGGMLLRVVAPRVRGVGVVCDGGGSAVVRREMTAILCAALDIGASDVHIASGGTQPQ